MLIDGISRKDLAQLAMATIVAANTLAGKRVYEPRDWPTRPELFPMLLIQAPTDRKVSLGRGIPQFNTTITLTVVGRAVGLSPEEVSKSLDLLSTQIEDALLCTTAFVENIQQFASVTTTSVVSAEAKQHIGEIGMQFEIEVYQMYGPDDGDPLEKIELDITDSMTGEQLAEAAVPFPQS